MNETNIEPYYEYVRKMHDAGIVKGREKQSENRQRKTFYTSTKLRKNLVNNIDLRLHSAYYLQNPWRNMCYMEIITGL